MIYRITYKDTRAYVEYSELTPGADATSICIYYPTADIGIFLDRGTHKRPLLRYQAEQFRLLEEVAEDRMETPNIIYEVFE